jgi:hypothetical protein
MRVRHPYALEDGPPAPDARVHYGGRRETAEVDEDGVFEVPDSARGRLESWAEGYGYDLAELVVDEDSDGKLVEVDPVENGVCPWCEDYEGEHVGQHASSAHPDKWAAYTEGD